MARSQAADRQFLEQHHGKWRVVVSVPRPLQKRLGTKLKRPLNTDSLAVANQLKWKVVTELHELIHEATLEDDPKHSLTREALDIAASRAKAEADTDLIDDVIYMRADEIRGTPIDEAKDEETGQPYPLYDPERERRAGLYAAMARGKATPLASYHEQYLTQAVTKKRTKGDDRRAIAYLKTWCEQNHVKPILQAINRKVATRFMDGLHTVAPGTNTTLNKYIGRLRQYWDWLEKREHVPDNPWLGLKLRAAETPYNERERPFTDNEMVKLLEGLAPTKLRDVMLIGALTGARLDPIVDLKVKDCTDGLFVFKPQKKEGRERAVPIHSSLKSLVKRRTKDKRPDDDLFPDWPAPKKASSQRERSFKTSNAFTEYRRKVGVDDVVPGKRRSLVNFHSFRRWFITKAEQADQPKHIVAAVVGHTSGREGETLSRYSAGPLVAQARRCVEAVKLPKHKLPKGIDH